MNIDTAISNKLLIRANEFWSLVSFLYEMPIQYLYIYKSIQILALHNFMT